MKKIRPMGFTGYVKERLRDRSFLVIAALYIAFCLFAGIRWIIGGVAGHVILSLGFILFIPAMLIVEYVMSMRFGAVFTVAALLIAVGGILGSPFSMYSILPCFDDILHTLSGFVFAALGFAVVEFFFGRADTPKKRVGSLMLAILFSLGIAVLWELWEFSGMLLLGMETADDTIVSGFTTFFFTGRAEPLVVNDVIKTVIYYGDGQTLVVDGYLDIGYFDTLKDMIVCTLGAIAFVITYAVGARLPRLRNALVPCVISKGDSYDASDISGQGGKTDSVQCEAESSDTAAGVFCENNGAEARIENASLAPSDQ